jgi:hypothetical protein
MGAPVSLEYPELSRWIWPWVELGDGRLVSNVVADVPSAAEVCSSGPQLWRDDAGEPVSILPLTEEEEKENAERDDGRKLTLAPQGGFVHEGAGYLYYERSLSGPGIFDAELIGTGLCVLDAGAERGSCRRVEYEGGDLLFPPRALPLNQGGLVDGERALIFGCRQVGWLTHHCTITGVPVTDAENPEQYAYLGGGEESGFNAWVSDPSNARIVMETPGAMTVSAFRGKNIATLLNVFDASVELSFAPEPTGEFERPIALFDIVRPESFFPGGGREHSALREASDELNVSYTTNAAGRLFGLHLATFRVNEGLE